MKAEDVVISEDALSERFLAATGPGGQNVNKVATACQLRVDVFKLGLSPDAYERLKGIACVTTRRPLGRTVRRCAGVVAGLGRERAGVAVTPDPRPRPARRPRTDRPRRAAFPPARG